MNVLYCSGSIRKFEQKEGKRLMFSLGIRRDYKNEKTGKYDYDNVTFFVSNKNESTIKFVNSYVKDGDAVEVQGYIYTYPTGEGDSRVYHVEHICDKIRFAPTSVSKAETGNSDTAAKAPPESDNLGFVEVSDDDCPF